MNVMECEICVKGTCNEGMEDKSWCRSKASYVNITETVK